MQEWEEFLFFSPCSSSTRFTAGPCTVFVAPQRSPHWPVLGPDERVPQLIKASIPWCHHEIFTLVNNGGSSHYGWASTQCLSLQLDSKLIQTHGGYLKKQKRQSVADVLRCQWCRNYLELPCCFWIRDALDCLHFQVFSFDHLTNGKHYCGSSIFIDNENNI